MTGLPDGVSCVLPDGVTYEGYVELETGVETCGIIANAEIIRTTCPVQAMCEDPLALSIEGTDANEGAPTQCN